MRDRLLGLGHAGPDRVRAERLARMCDQRLLNSLRYLANLAAQELDIGLSELSERLDSTEAAIASGSGLSHRAYSLNNRLAREMREGNPRAIRTTLSSLADSHLACRSPTKIARYPTANAEDPGDTCFQSELVLEHKLAYDCHFDATAPSDVAYPEARRSVESAMSVLAEVDGDSYGELQALVRHVLLMKCAETSGGSSIVGFGAVYLRAEPYSARSWVGYLEDLVHESAHHVLFATMANFQLLKNDSTRHPSPLRNQPRPLSAVLHQFYVLARLIRAERLFSRRGICRLGVEVEYSGARKGATFDEMFQAAAAELDQNRHRLTRLGRSIVASAERLVAQSSEDTHCR